MIQVSNTSLATIVATAVLHSSKQGAKQHDDETGAVGTMALPNLAASSAVISKAVLRSSKSAASTSAFKGVTKHKSTGKFEAHLWDSTHVRVVKVRHGFLPPEAC